MELDLSEDAFRLRDPWLFSLLPQVVPIEDPDFDRESGRVLSTTRCFAH
jgi:hypothetical protein